MNRPPDHERVSHKGLVVLSNSFFLLCVNYQAPWSLVMNTSDITPLVRSVVEAILLLGVFADFDGFVVHPNVFQGSTGDVDVVRRQPRMLIQLTIQVLVGIEKAGWDRGVVLRSGAALSASRRASTLVFPPIPPKHRQTH